MPGKALLVGAQTGGLAGVENDVAALAETLGKRGFEVTRCEGGAATRTGIVAAYDALIARVAPDEPAVVYYSGHGGLVRRPETGAPGPQLLDLQFIVPTDYAESTEDDFRGITSVELSVLLARLTERTRNAVVILDCCHAALMSRDPDLRVKALPHPLSYDLLRAHVERQKDRGLRTELRRPLGNPHAVRIVACAPDQSAYEYTNANGHRTGMLTESLTLALAEVGDLKVTWSTVLDRVRRRVLLRAVDQRPEAEGPARRLLFEVVEAEPLATLPAVGTAPGRVRLDGGRLLGVRVGDEFAIMPDAVTGPDAAGRIGSATVDGLGPTAAMAELRLAPGVPAVPVGARAHRTKAVAPAMPVRVPHPDPRTARLVRAMSGSSFVRVAETHEPDDPWLAEVHVGDAGELTVHDRVGPLHEPRAGDDAGIARVVRDLESLARATAVRTLTDDPRWPLEVPVTVEWGRVVDDRTLAAEPKLYAGERVYARVRNDGTVPVYTSLVDVGVAGRVSVLTRFAPSGVHLPPGREYVFGWDDLSGQLTGVELTWPDGLDPALAREETIVVLVASQPVDITLLEQDGVRRDHQPPRSALERTLDQLATGGTRDLPAGSGPEVRYAVRTITFALDPGAPRSPDHSLAHRVEDAV